MRFWKSYICSNKLDRNKLQFHTVQQNPKSSLWTRIYVVRGEMAREMGSPRQVSNRRRRTREGPEPACVQTPNPDRVAHAGGRG